MTTEPSSKRRKVAAPKRSGKKASSKPFTAKEVKECMAGIARWFPLATDATATLEAVKDVAVWKAYFKMRELYPGMPLVVLEGEEAESDGEDDEGAEAEGDENVPVPVGNEPTEDAAAKMQLLPDAAAAVGKVESYAGDPAKPPVATTEAVLAEDQAGPSSKEAEAAEDSDADDASDGSGQEGEEGEAEGDDEEEESDDEDAVDPLDGDDLLGEEEDALEKCMGFPAFEVAEGIFDDAASVVGHAHALVDKIFLHENRQNLQTCVRMYSLGKPQAVDLRMQFYHKTRGDETEHVYNLYYRVANAEQVVIEQNTGDEWTPVWMSYTAADGKLNHKLQLTAAQANAVRDALFAGSQLEASGGAEDGKVPTADLWKFLLTAVGVAGTDLVKGYSEAVLEGVAAVCAPEAADASKLTDDYDEAGPAFDDPFDSEDYPVQEGCAQQ